MYNEGISYAGDILDTGVLLQVIAKNGNSYLFEDIKLGVGREAVKTFLKENKDITAKIDKAIRQKIKDGDTIPEKDEPKESLDEE
jgi:recombination protein RecA